MADCKKCIHSDICIFIEENPDCIQFKDRAYYRKASEVVEEIEKYILEGAATIEGNNSDSMYGAKFAIEKVVLPILEAFKKKYMEQEK